MVGLILKDLLNLKRQAKLILLVLIFYLIMGAKSDQAEFFSVVIMLFFPVLIISTFSFDERCNWPRYALVMPVTRKEIVLSKYVSGFLFIVGGGVISLVYLGIINQINRESSFLFIITAASVVMFYFSIIFPIVIRFGSEKGRIAMFLIFLIPYCVYMFLLNNNGIKMPSINNIRAIEYTIPIVSICTYIISGYIATGIFNKMDIN